MAGGLWWRRRRLFLRICGDVCLVGSPRRRRRSGVVHDRDGARRGGGGRRRQGPVSLGQWERGDGDAVFVDEVGHLGGGGGDSQGRPHVGLSELDGGDDAFRGAHGDEVEAVDDLAAADRVEVRQQVCQRAAVGVGGTRGERGLEQRQVRTVSAVLAARSAEELDEALVQGAETGQGRALGEPDEDDARQSSLVVVEAANLRREREAAQRRRIDLLEPLDQSFLGAVLVAARESDRDVEVLRRN
mmetsp:Transcript_15693/g.47462  ORF Transcript_15693/g.47462 Transcript_15693/m.47462 type:complete len:244 (+) Transcript_15693:86-817(+)